MKKNLRISNFTIPVVRKMIISELSSRHRRKTVQIDVMSGMGWDGMGMPNEQPTALFEEYCVFSSEF